MQGAKQMQGAKMEKAGMTEDVDEDNKNERLEEGSYEKGLRTLSRPQQQKLMQFRADMLDQFTITCNLSKEIEKSLPFDSIRTDLGKARRDAEYKIDQLLSGGLLEMQIIAIGPVDLIEEAVAAVHPLFIDIVDLNHAIHELTQDILREAPSMRSMWINWGVIAPIRVGEICARINPALDAVEDLGLEIMGNAYFQSGIMLCHQMNFDTSDTKLLRGFFQ